MLELLQIRTCKDHSGNLMDKNAATERAFLECTAPMYVPSSHLSPAAAGPWLWGGCSCQLFWTPPPSTMWQRAGHRWCRRRGGLWHSETALSCCQSTQSVHSKNCELLYSTLRSHFNFHHTTLGHMTHHMHAIGHTTNAIQLNDVNWLGLEGVWN